MVKLVYVNFDDNLDYQAVVNSFYIKKFAEPVFGDLPSFIPFEEFEFDKSKLESTVQEQFDKSIDYICETRKLPQKMIDGYYSAAGETGCDLKLVDFEGELCTLDEHLVTINKGKKVLGFMTTDYDFEKLIEL